MIPPTSLGITIPISSAVSSTVLSSLRTPMATRTTLGSAIGLHSDQRCPYSKSHIHIRDLRRHRGVAAAFQARHRLVGRLTVYDFSNPRDEAVEKYAMGPVPSQDQTPSFLVPFPYPFRLDPYPADVCPHDVCPCPCRAHDEGRVHSVLVSRARVLYRGSCLCHDLFRDQNLFPCQYRVCYFQESDLAQSAHCAIRVGGRVQPLKAHLRERSVWPLHFQDLSCLASTSRAYCSNWFGCQHWHCEYPVASKGIWNVENDLNDLHHYRVVRDRSGLPFVSCEAPARMQFGLVHLEVP